MERSLTSVDALAARYSNEGRWQPEGPACALALTTPRRRLDACAMPQRGHLVACGLAPGEAPADVATRILAARPARNGVAGRGVLLDLPRAERCAALAPGEAIDPERLDACAERLGVTVEAGDLLLVRTGWLAAARRRDDWPAYQVGASPGLGLECAGWLYRREIALLASDTRAVEALLEHPAQGLPLREVAHAASGIAFGIDFDLEALADACREDGNYAFLLVVPPLPAAGANPARPVALK